MATGDLCTLTQAKAYLGLKTNDDDPLLSSIITGCSAWIKSFINRDIVQATYTATLDGTGTSTMVFPQYPVTAVSSLKVDGVTIPARSAVGNVGYAFDPHKIALYGYSFPKGLHNVEITYTAGYPAVPSDLERSAVEMVAWRYRERDRIGQSSKNLGGEVISFQTGEAPNHVKAILQNWKKVCPVI